MFLCHIGNERSGQVHFIVEYIISYSVGTAEIDGNQVNFKDPCYYHST